MAELKNTTITDSGYFRLPSGTTTQRPENPVAGMIRYNTDSNLKEYFDGNKWIFDGYNIITPENWITGSGSINEFNQNGSTVENERIVGEGPFGSTILWECRPEAASGADGGWNTNLFPIDPTFKYRFSVWAKRPVAGNGHLYLGTRGYDSSVTNIGVLNRSDGAVNTNPYFEVNSHWSAWSENDINTWYLVVGHVWPVGSSTGTEDPDSGVYKTNGTKLTTSDKIDFVWQENNTQAVHRCYLYYSTDTSTRQQLVYPRVSKLSGSYPTINDLLSGYNG